MMSMEECRMKKSSNCFSTLSQPSHIEIEEITNNLRQVSQNPGEIPTTCELNMESTI